MELTTKKKSSLRSLYTLFNYSFLLFFLSVLIAPLCIAQESKSETVERAALPVVKGTTTFTLQESIAFARENSKKIKSAMQDVELAEGKVDEAISGMLPKLSANGSYAYFIEPPIIMDEKTMADMQRVMQGIISDMLPSDGATQQQQPDEQQSTNEGTPLPALPSGNENSTVGNGDTDTATADKGTADTTGETDGVVSAIEADRHNYQASLSLQQPLFTWGKLYNGYKQAKLNLKAAKQGLESTKQKLDLEVTKAFYGVVLAQEFVEVSEKAVAQVEKHVKTANDLLEAGVATDFDVLRASVQLANMRSRLIKAKNRLRLAKEGFKVTLGLPLENEVNVDGQLEYNEQKVELDELLQLAKRNRPDLKQLELQKKAGEKLVNIAEAGNKPNLIFMSNYNANLSTDFEEDVDRSWKRTWNVTLALDIPIFDGLATRAKAKQAKSGLRKIELGEAQLEDGIQLEVKSAYLSLQEAQSLIDAQKETVEQAKEGLRIANLRHENGMITTVELTDAELALTQARVNRLQALYDYTVAIAKLEKAIGKKL